MKNIIILLLLVLSFAKTTGLNINSTLPTLNPIKNTLYSGTLGNTKISLYITEQEHPCGGNKTIINAMYKYDSQENWILLNVHTDTKKKKYCMVEENFTGVLFLDKKENNFEGKWVAPNAKNQFNVDLQKLEIDVKYAKDHTLIEQLDKILFDQLLYNKNDC